MMFQFILISINTISIAVWVNELYSVFCNNKDQHDVGIIGIVISADTVLTDIVGIVLNEYFLV